MRLTTTRQSEILLSSSLNSSASTGLIIVVMGVSGCGKSTIAERLAQQLNTGYKDADALHPERNIELMSKGRALTDGDRLPWLESVSAYGQQQVGNGQACIIACSALKRSYREILNGAGRVLYVYLHGSRALILSRLQSRQGHFMSEQLLQSQFDALEVPDPASEQVISVDIDTDIENIVASAAAQVRAHALFLQ